MEIDVAIHQIESAFERDLALVRSSHDIEQLHIKYLGKKGLVPSLMEPLKMAPVTLKPALGQRINLLKQHIVAALDERGHALHEQELENRLHRERLDVTLPGRRRYPGHRHVVLAMLDEAVEILRHMGFSVQFGPDIDTDYYNFESLNFPLDHPARDMHDTFYIGPDVLLRTHTSNTQVRLMGSVAPPLRVIVPGKCYRNEEVSARSHVCFHQIEGIYIDDQVTFADLMNTLNEFIGLFFKREMQVRFRPSYFPFVEPGVEVDVGCLVCDGSGCAVCKRSGWLEVMGAGMIHPEVMKNGGLDADTYSGYAFGFGIERLAMMRYAIDDIRHFFENDVRFLQQF